MKLLSVDTATEACSAALLVDGELAERYQLAPREHSHLILGMIDELMAEAGLTPPELDLLAFGRGPGSFMGIRIAAGVVQGIAFAHDLPVVPVSTLQSIAFNAHEERGADRVLAAIDARMKEVYWGQYQLDAEGEMRLLGNEAVCAPGQVTLPDSGHWLGAGTAWETYAEALAALCGERLQHSLPQCMPSAASIARLAVAAHRRGEAVAADAAVPVYLRDKVAAKPKTAGNIL